MPEQLECRIRIIHRKDMKIDLSMIDPKTGRIEELGCHGPNLKDIDKVVIDLKRSIEQAGHRLTFCERSE